MQILSERGRQWISSRTGQGVILDKFLFFNLNVNRLSSTPLTIQLYGPRQELGELPEEHATQKAMDILYYSNLKFGIHVFDRDLLQQTVAKAYRFPADISSSKLQISAKACVWALHSITDWLQRIRNQSSFIDSENCFNRAQALLGLVVEDSTLEVLQAALLLVSRISANLLNSNVNHGS